jgi:hypothetical protein
VENVCKESVCVWGNVCGEMYVGKCMNHTHKTPSIQWKAPGQLRWKSHAVAYTDGSKRDPGRAGAGVYFPDASNSILQASPLPVEEALQNEVPRNPAWQGYTIAGVQNSLRAEVVALRQAVRLWNDHARLVAFIDCLTALHMVSRLVGTGTNRTPWLSTMNSHS